MISSATTHGLPSVLHGVRMDSRTDIVSALCKLSQEGAKEKLADFLRDERARKVIDVDHEGREEKPFSPLGRALSAQKLECALLLLRYGADTHCNNGRGDTAIESVTEKTFLYCRTLNENTKRDLSIAIIANRILINNVPALIELLRNKSSSQHLFSANLLLTEIKLHFRVNELESCQLEGMIANINGQDDISDRNKEEFAQFCAEFCDAASLDNDKPEPQSLDIVVQSICSTMLQTPYKKQFLEMLLLEAKSGLEFIQTVKNKFLENFAKIFEEFFLKDPAEAESIILGNYQPLFLDMVQIFHYHISPDCKKRLQDILLKVQAISRKEPIAVGTLQQLAAAEQRITAAESENAILKKRVDTLEKLVQGLLLHKV